ncbi:exodeoxyribonuclease VII large subunit [Herbaspirillum sp. RTI4]|uniref:exodeoxyribonuclease VII large subunit n=1 Tax=Herbaspirillum sp. RTI4 TaxID=3048640 RepID=UPI002AB50DB6|nr:exodeoxyribonuclease VII large subunit [Herbaspirillum sp. RTI4]MDY7577899.1 exodeoxyribonuclease VII large subunit [Herbaspirillum sp. RTI4]MEA9981655.1 exodeoxyribonuclease VII large subunit [Herbaspirillum sp. RTI4]
MNFDDNEPRSSAAAPVLAVSALNQAVARLLERNFPLIWVAGEVSNFTRAASGHWYFTLKDAAAQVRSVMFRGRAQYADFLPREGDKVEVRTLVTLYAPRGDYQLSVESIRRAGVGNLYEAFLRLKAKLEAEGLFAPERKRPVPTFARCIGIVTSLQAAALRDILTTLERRAPHVRVILYPTPVQGEGAAQKIAQAIRLAARRAECDLLLVCRGGGSIEDLWSFNDEEVARAIVASPMPVIAGIGHETDFTIADFAADLRAPTPTAAAEIAAPARDDWFQSLHAGAQALRRAWQRQASDHAQQLDWLAHRLISPAAYIRHERLKLVGAQTRLQHAAAQPLSLARHALQHWHTRLRHCRPDSAAQRQQLADHARRLSSADRAARAGQRQALHALQTQLEMLNPQRTLERGYAIVTDAKGRILRSPAQLKPQAQIGLRLAEGSADIGVATVQPKLE